MYRKDHTLFQTIVDVGGFEGGVITGPSHRGIILRVEINPTGIIVVRWKPEKENIIILPIVFNFRAITHYHGQSEEGEDEEYFVVRLSHELRHQWVLYRATQTTVVEPTPDAPPWGE